jgi:signal transduction histidine kinase
MLKLGHILGLLTMSGTFYADYALKRKAFEAAERGRILIEYLTHEYGQVKAELAYDLKKLETIAVGRASGIPRELTTGIVSNLEQVTGLMESYQILRKEDSERETEYGPKHYNVNSMIDASILSLKILMKPNVSWGKSYCAAPMVFGREFELSQIFRNILKNAIEATQNLKIGRIEISTMIVKDERKTPTAVRVRIRNDGPPIPHEDVGKIFTDGFTTKEGTGRGHGLFIVKKLLDKYGGSIDVEASKQGSGTGRDAVAFELVLPYSADDD